MLLKHFFDYAQSRNLLADLAFAPKTVRWIIDLNTAGDCLGVVETGDGKRGHEFYCPQTTRRKEAGGVAEFLADGITAIFGCDSEPDPKKNRTEKQEKDRQKNNALKHEDFWEQIEAAAAETGHPGLSALQTFCQKLAARDANILRYGKTAVAKADANFVWLLQVSGEEKKLGSENFTFRVDGELLIENSTIRAWWREQHTAEVNAARGNAARGLCLVTGLANQPIALTHSPKISGVPNTQTFGAAVVSFDKAAFTSYGFDQSLNAPTSDEAATAYCSALNHLITNENTSLRIGQSMLCFWAVQTKAAGGRFAQLLNKPDPQSVRNFLVSPWAGMDRDLAKKDTFLAVTLAGNSGRVVVRHWLQQTLEQAIENFHNWFADLKIQVPPKIQSAQKSKKTDKKTEYNPLAVYWLANTTVREAKDLSPEIPAQLYRAALENTAPSPMLIKPILTQLQSRLLRDENYSLIYDQSRFALLKLIVNRNRKETDMEIKTSLTADTHDPAYNCGRLLSVLSETQKKAQGYPKGFSGVAERYFGTASVSPATVLPLLLRLNRHHLDKIRKTGGNAYEEVIIRNIVAKFKPAGEAMPPVFPRTLDLQAQGRFAIGFYQQQAEDSNARIAFKVLMYLEETDAAAHTQTLALQEDNPQAFYEKVSQHYGSVSFKEWMDKKKKNVKASSSSNVSELFDNE
jgi:CRISPR-associated protein Csd1